MKRFLSAVLSLVLILALFSACSLGYKEPPEGGFIILEHFDGYKLGIVEGQDKAEVREKIGNPDIKTFKTAEEGIEALRNKEIHGMLLPATVADKAISESSDFLKLLDTFDDKKLSGISLNSSKFIIPIEAAITKIKNNGALNRIVAKYYPSDDAGESYVAPESGEVVEGRVLRVGLSKENNFPFTYRDTSGNIVGINIDVAREIVADFGAELKVIEYPEEELTDALDNGEVDFIMNRFSPYEGAPEEHIFSDSYYDDSSYILINSPLANLSK